MHTPASRQAVFQGLEAGAVDLSQIHSVIICEFPCSGRKGGNNSLLARVGNSVRGAKVLARGDLDGQKFLAMTLAALNLLAFACHTMLELLEPPWQAAREAAAKRTSFFAHIAIWGVIFLLGGQLRHSRGLSAGVAHGQPRGPYHILWVRGFRAHTISRRAIQSFQAVAAPFPGHSVLPSATRASSPATETPRFKRSMIGSAISHRAGDTRTNIERLRNSGKKFVERV